MKKCVSTMLMASMMVGLLVGCSGKAPAKEAGENQAEVIVDESLNLWNKESGKAPAGNYIDLFGVWKFSMYKVYRPRDTSFIDLDDVANVTEDVYKTWEDTVPCTGWWPDNKTGYGWYVKEFDYDTSLPDEDLVLSVGRFDEANEVYVNGTLVGSNGMNYDKGLAVYDESNPWEDDCLYSFDKTLLKTDEKNVIAVKICNSTGGGGWYQGPVGICSAEDFDNTIEKTAAMEEGRWFSTTYESPKLGHEAEYRMYLPEGYEESSDSYPVMVLLHGMNSSSKTYEIDKIDELMDEAIKSGEIDPMILVVPSDETGMDFWQEPLVSWICDELIPMVDESYRTIADKEHRYIAGCSMGGSGSFTIGMRRPELFSGLISFYGAFSYGGNNAVAVSLSEEDIKSFRIYMASGEQDEYQFNVAQEKMAKILEEKGATFYSEIAPGAHNSDFYLPRFIPAIKYIQGKE